MSTGTLAFTINNNSGSPKPAYLYLFSNASLQYLADRNGTIAPFPKHVQGGSYGVELQPGMNPLRLPQLEAVRGYVSIGAPLKITTDGDGRPVGVDAGTPNDAKANNNPNYDLMWDFFELNWLARDTGGIETSRLHANLTQVDSFGLALRLEFSGLDPADPSQEKRFDMGIASDTARTEIFAELAATQPWNTLIVENPQGEQVRALMPGFAIAYGHPFPSDQLDGYIHACLDFYAKNPLTLEFAGVNYRCVIEDRRFAFISDTDGKKYTMAIEGLAPPITRTKTGTEAIYRNVIQPTPDDGTGRGIAAVLGASLLRSTLMHDARCPVPQAARDRYFQNDPVFLYAKAIHDRSIDQHAFCFGYDEVELDAGNGEVINPTSLTLTIHAIAT